MNRLFIYIFVLLFFSNSYAKDISEFFNNLIPGEGLTEASIQINEDDNPDIEILALRDIESTDNSNLFTQFSLHTQETNGHNRLIGNIGLGYRKLSNDKSNVVGVNLFLAVGNVRSVRDILFVNEEYNSGTLNFSKWQKLK